jgi:TolA-binding protein
MTIRTIAVLLLLPGTTGCFWVTTKHEGTQMRRDIDTLQSRVDGALSSRVEKLQQVLDEATKLLQRNSADLGAEVNDLTQENAKLNGLVMEAKRQSDSMQNDLAAIKTSYEQRIAELERRLITLEEKQTRVPSKSAADLFQEGKAALDDGKLAEARELLKTLVAKYPADERADDAQFYRAEAHYRDKQYETAIGEFQKVFDRYAESPLADDALYRAGEAAEQLKWCTDARAYFGVLKQKYPKSSFLRHAARKEAQLKKLSGDKGKCKN